MIEGGSGMTESLFDRAVILVFQIIECASVVWFFVCLFLVLAWFPYEAFFTYWLRELMR